MHHPLEHRAPRASLAAVATASRGAVLSLIATALLALPVLAAHPIWISDDDSMEPQAPAAASLQLRPGVSTARGALPAAMSWSADPSLNLLVNNASDLQYFSAAASDGAGGMIVAWEDYRNFAISGRAIYAQHVLKCGVVDPTWPPDGVVVATGAGNVRDGVADRAFPVIVSDGSGGALVAWAKGDLPALDIFAQHVLNGGTVDPAWPANGAGVCTAVGQQSTPKITSDGAHGAFLTWDDRRGGALIRRVFVQHLLSTGVDPSWAVDGVPACPASAPSQNFPVICSDGAGGAIVGWSDSRDLPVRRDLYAQRLSPTGALLWAAGGQPCCLAPGQNRFFNGAGGASIWVTSSADDQGNAIVPDGAGGCFMTWVDERNLAFTGDDVYAQRLTASGAVAAGWAPNGVALCGAPGNQTAATILADGAGGAIASWSESSAGPVAARPGVFAQHVTGAGVVDGPAGGLMISSAGGTVTWFMPDIVSDGAGGAVLAWSDPRNVSTSGYDMFAQRVRTSPTFAVDPGWPTDGTPLSVAPGDQVNNVAGAGISDGAGGMIISWDDNRDLATTDTDLYAQAVLVTGALPAAPAAPRVTLTGPAGGAVFPINTPVSFTGSFTDDPADTHTAQWTFDALPVVAGTVNEATQTVSATTTFATAGVYAVKLTVTNQCGISGTATQVGGMDAFVVIYDPFAGFVTGGGWINSPAGAYAPDPTLTGKANFGFVSKYQKGKSTPDGETEFQFKVASLDFHGAVYDWLVISGARAQYQGSGTINGAGDYAFMLTAIDGQISGGGGTDKFRMKIIDKSTSTVVYDNQMGMSDSGDPTTVLGGGSIVIHPKPGAPGAPGGEVSAPRPAEYALSQNRPNPFGLLAEVQYSLPERSQVRIELYDLAGRRLTSLVDGAMEAGVHSATLTRQGSNANRLSEGVYFLRMTANSLEGGRHFAATRKVLVLK